jgi:ABC-type branched-subunit amino acid transport system substrate-binding protein
MTRAVLPAVAGLLIAPHTQAAPGMKIGAIVPDSWPDATRGEEIRNGMQLALKTWPGQPAPMLIVKDSACDPKRAAAAAQALVDAKVDVVMGGWCVLGVVPRMLKDAGVPFISGNAERVAATEGSLQFARLPVNVSDGIAARLRAETGLRVTASSTCWMDFEQRVPDKYDAALCPTLNIDKARWDDVAPTYAAAYRKPFSVSAARGYAAMQVALAYIKQVRAGAKPAVALREAQAADTILGRIPARDAPTPEDAMRLIFAAKLPKLSARESRALDQVMKAKGCGCTAGGDCLPENPWRAQPFVVQGAKGSDCSPLKLTSQR